MDEGDRANDELSVGESDLMMALDYIDKLDPEARCNDWYDRLSHALDMHLKPRSKAYAERKPTRH